MRDPYPRRELKNVVMADDECESGAVEPFHFKQQGIRLRDSETLGWSLAPTLRRSHHY